MPAVDPPVRTFESEGGRTFTLAVGEREATPWGDSDAFPILYEGMPAGKLFHGPTYGTTADGKFRWHASTRQIYWSKASDAPTGIGFDVAAFDTAEACLAAWAHSADQILDWAAGRPVPCLYSKTGVYQRGAA